MGLESIKIQEVPEIKLRILFNKYLAVQLILPLLGGFLYGYNTAVISGVQLVLGNNHYHWQLIVAATPVAAAASVILGGVLAERYGRKVALFVSSIFLIVGAIIMGFNIDEPVLIVGRVLLGFGIGLEASSGPIYISEISPKEIRGRLIVLYQASIAGGQFCAAIVNVLFQIALSKTGARLMMGFAAIPAIFLALGLIFMPESHRWLLSKGYLRKAKKVIKKEGRINEELIDEYVDSILLFYEESEQELKNKNLHNRSLMYQILQSNVARRSLIVGCLVEIIQQAVGINGIIYYSSSILNMAGVESHKIVLRYTMLIMFFCFAPLIISYFLIDRIGRRKLFIGSLLGIIIGTAILAVGFQLIYVNSLPVTNITNTFTDQGCYNKANCEACVTSPSCGFCSITNKTYASCLRSNSTYSKDGYCDVEQLKKLNGIFRVGSCESTLSSIIITGMIVYLLSFAVGTGPVPYVVTSEIYPVWCRGINMAISLTFNWIGNILVSLTFLTLTEYLTRYGTFWLFAGISCCGLGIVYRWLPETKDVELEEMEKLIE